VYLGNPTFLEKKRQKNGGFGKGPDGKGKKAGNLQNRV